MGLLRRRRGEQSSVVGIAKRDLEVRKIAQERSADARIPVVESQGARMIATSGPKVASRRGALSHSSSHGPLSGCWVGSSSAVIALRRAASYTASWKAPVDR